MLKRKRSEEDDEQIETDGDRSEGDIKDWQALAYFYIDKILTKTDIIEDMQASMDEVENDARFLNAFQDMKKLAFEYCDDTPELENLSDMAIICTLATSFIRRFANRMTMDQWVEMCSFRNAQLGFGIDDGTIGVNQMIFLEDHSSVTYRLSIDDLFDDYHASEFKFLTVRVVHPEERVCEETRLDDDGDPYGELIEDLRLPVNEEQGFKIQGDGYSRLTITPDGVIVLEDRLPGWIEQLGVDQNTEVVKIQTGDGTKLVLDFERNDAFLTPYGIDGTSFYEVA